MCKAIKDFFTKCFKKKEPYVDPDRAMYREFFNIIDDYLIEYSIEQEEGEEQHYSLEKKNDNTWDPGKAAIKDADSYHKEAKEFSHKLMENSA